MFKLILSISRWTFQKCGGQEKFGASTKCWRQRKRFSSRPQNKKYGSVFGILYRNDIHSCFAHWQIMTCNWGIQTWWVKRSEAKVKPCIIIRRDRCMNLSQIFSILSVWGIPLEFKSLTPKDFFILQSANESGEMLQENVWSVGRSTNHHF